MQNEGGGNHQLKFCLLFVKQQKQQKSYNKVTKRTISNFKS